jgi:xanthine dehydrogenase YagT iron-sulfur-binding subunit
MSSESKSCFSKPDLANKPDPANKPNPANKAERAASDAVGHVGPVMTAPVSRRNFMQSLGLSAAAATIAGNADALARETARVAQGTQDPDNVSIGPGVATMELTINGERKQVQVEPATTLLEVLRYHLGLTGSKEVCDRGSCGACSVLVDGELMIACMMLVGDAVGRNITTVEGLSKDGKLDPVQTMFIKHDALQCGFCTPGLVVASRWLLNNNPSPTLNQIKSGLAGNICRCGTYTNVFNAVLEASGQSPVMDPAMA